MSPENLKSVFASSALQTQQEFDENLLLSENAKKQIEISKSETSSRSEKNKDLKDVIHAHNKRHGYGDVRHPGYENSHGVEEGKLNDKKLDFEDVQRDDRENLIEFDPSALELAKLNYKNAMTSYAYIERKHRSMFESLNKYFNSTNIGSKIVETKVGSKLKHEENADVKGEKKRFEDSLKAYREVWMKDIKRRMKLEEGKLEGESLENEIKEMLATFNCQSAIDLAAERNFAKAEMLWGSDSQNNIKPVQKKFDPDFNGPQQSVTGRPTNISQAGEPVKDKDGNVYYGKDGKSVYSDVYEKNVNKVELEKRTIKEKILDKKDELKDKFTDLETYKNIVCSGAKASWAGMEMVGGAYKKMPAVVKFGLGVAAIGSGVGALIAGRRIIAGVSAGVGTAALLDARQQRSLQKKSGYGNALNMQEIIKENVVDFDKLRKITDSQISQIDDKMNNLKIGTWFNRAAGTALAIAIGNGWAQDAARYGFGKIWGGAKIAASHMFNMSAFGASAANAAEIPTGANMPTSAVEHTAVTGHPLESTNALEEQHRLEEAKMHDYQNGKKNWSTNSLEHEQYIQHEQSLAGNHVSPNAHAHELKLQTAEGRSWSENAYGQNVAMENAPVSADVPLTIEKGSSIERTLVDHIKKVHPDIKNPGNAAHRMWLDYMDDNKKDIIAKVGDAEYQKMLKDGMVNVKPGTVLMIDEHNPLKLKLDNIEGKISHLNGHHHAPLHVPSHVPSHVPTHGVADAPTNETYNEWNKDVTRSAIENAAAEKEKYDIASAITRHEVPNLDPNSPNYVDNLKYTETLQKAAASDLYNWGPSYEVGRLGELMKHSREHMQSLLDMPDNATFSKIGRDFFDNKKSNILKFGGMNVREALNNPDENLKGLSAKAKKLIVGYANSDATKPKPNETFKVWSYRIMTLTRGASAQKLAA